MKVEEEDAGIDAEPQALRHGHLKAPRRPWLPRFDACEEALRLHRG